MYIPTESDWGFQDIRKSDFTNRANRLENADTPDQLVQTLKKELQKACQNGDCRVGVDSSENEFKENRAIIQFKVDPETYDWFFNARTGYRAQFWINENNGIDFNQKLVTVLRNTLLENILPSITARKIEVIKNGDSREDHDVGEKSLTHDEIKSSLEPKTSKIWICERLIQSDGSSPKNIWQAVLSENDPKLCIPRWEDGKAKGLLAPFPGPIAEYSWLDLKGAFVAKDGKTYQKKDPSDRADSLNKKGWT